MALFRLIFNRARSEKQAIVLLKKIHDTQVPRERALLVGTHIQGRNGIPVEDSLEELALLADTAGVDVIETVTQNIRHLDPSTFVGKGKVHEIAKAVAENAIDIVIFDDDLSPAQSKNLEKTVKKRVIDRSALILDIFAKRAKTRESKTQVELAQLQYLLPRLTRIWTHLERQTGGGVFTKGPGETQLETDRRLIGNRIAILKDELKKIERQRETQRQSRHDVFRVALVGYTNAGKSTLLNALSRSDVHVEDRLFATLDATSRRVYMDRDHPCIVTDTVGFIRKLPHSLVASFRSTLEEVRDADLLIHVIDLHNVHFMDQMETVNGVLTELGASPPSALLAFNKLDRVDDEEKLDNLHRQFPQAVFLSAAREIGLDQLRAAVIREMQKDYVEREIEFPVTDGKLYATLRHLSTILDTVEDNGTMRVTFRAKKGDAEKIFQQQSKHLELLKIQS